MTKASNPGPDLAERAGYLIEVAARAPSVHNTQPWRFTVTGQAIDLYADADRQLLEDPAGREMIISCGAAYSGCGSRSARWVTGPRSTCSPNPARGSCWPGYGQAARHP